MKSKERTAYESPENAGNKSRKIKVFTIGNICFGLAVVLIIVSGLFIAETIRTGGESAQSAYDSAKSKAAEEAYNKFYDAAFASAERKYHVSQKV